MNIDAEKPRANTIRRLKEMGEKKRSVRSEGMHKTQEKYNSHE